jgi:hypothetical protein
VGPPATRTTEPKERTTVDSHLTHQPWKYTTPSGTILTVTHAGIRDEPGHAEVLIRITADKRTAAEIGVTTADMPGLISAIEQQTVWERNTPDGGAIGVSPGGPGWGVAIGVTEVHHVTSDLSGGYETSTGILLPDEQRLPLVSALRRAADVARGWEA